MSTTATKTETAGTSQNQTLDGRDLYKLYLNLQGKHILTSNSHCSLSPTLGKRSTKLGSAADIYCQYILLYVGDKAWTC